MGWGDGLGWVLWEVPPPHLPPGPLLHPRCRRGPSVRSRVCGGGLIGNSLSADGRQRGNFLFFSSCEPSKQNTTMGMWMCAHRGPWRIGPGTEFAVKINKNVQYVGVLEGWRRVESQQRAIYQEGSWANDSAEMLKEMQKKILPLTGSNQGKKGPMCKISSFCVSSFLFIQKMRKALLPFSGK